MNERHAANGPCRGQKILVVDDNEYTVRILRFALEKDGLQVMSAFSGEEAVRVLETEGLPDLAIVDYQMSPGMTGFEFCRFVHQFTDLPVIMLTAVADDSLRQTGLESHVEDYILKPFNPAVLLARVHNVLQRLGGFASSPLTRVDDHLMIDFPRQVAWVNGRVVPLTPIETKLLYVLMRQAGQPVNTSFILRRIWPDGTAFEDRLHVHVHRLRRKIENESAPAAYIVSKRGHGYIFQAN